ncbi:Aculeacin-A acylase [Sinobacterium norvegicum]|uniref:Aculeacin-A acylase n=1 Tax=Sinobacterium norvegicum TaxID=1641715 RepID=A0ABM9AA21_9GAMM|nr:penicillin acylase family protein [Sinobacterium norvegicum]CAH0990060.1 Aculeacin-A acylase [Sinobacterium norvegicum]
MKMKLLSAAVFAVALSGCSNDSDSDVNDSAPEFGTALYSADITETEHGIPHINAEDWGSLGYGYGYQYAKQNLCVLMEEVVRANGESARYLDGNINEDFVYRYYNSDTNIQSNFIDKLDQDARDVMDGYTLGINRYIEDTGVDNIAGSCQGEPWVRPLNQLDNYKALHKLLIRASTGPLAPFISAVNGPAESVANAPMADLFQQLALNTDAFDMPKPEQMGSNAYALGGNVTENGSGLLLGNPHFPWSGRLRWYMAHLTIDGEYDVMGASLHGFPLINIGFNKDIAWTHTVSTGRRFSFFELQLNPDNPMQYVYGQDDAGADIYRDITSEQVTAEQVRDDGSIETVEKTLYFSHYGPIVDLGGVSDLLEGWPTILKSVFTVRDVNLYNTWGFDTWRGMGQAENLDEVTEAAAKMGNPWTNTIAVDREGNSMYGDISTRPGITQWHFDNCVKGLAAPSLTDEGYPTLDGSDPSCEWATDADSPADGVMGVSQLPVLQNRDYAANSNDSYWLSNPDSLLTGFSPIIGNEEVEQSTRTRLAFVQLQDRLDDNDGLAGGDKFTNENVRDIMFGSRNHAAELILDGVLDVCANTTSADWGSEAADAEHACQILDDWDRESDVDSVGHALFIGLWAELDREAGFWQNDFDPAYPVTTPNTMNSGDATVIANTRAALLASVAELNQAGIPLDRPWGEVQYSERNGDKIAIHGSNGVGFSVIISDLIDGEGYSNIEHGNSYMQVVGFDSSDCPDANALLSYSQSVNEDSPYFDDQTKMYSAKQWVDMPFCASDIEAQQIGETMTLSN